MALRHGWGAMRLASDKGILEKKEEDNVGHTGAHFVKDLNGVYFFVVGRA